MVQCSVCYPTDITYQIKINGKINQSYFHAIIHHLKRREQLISYNDTFLVVKEASVLELYDFFNNHMDTNQISFCMGKENWKPIAEIVKTAESKWIDKIITEQSVTCHIQPIVDDTEAVFAYEILSRFRNENGNVVSPLDVFTAARLRNRTYALDRVCRMNAVQHATRINQKVFINFIPTSIYSPEHCLKSTVQLAQQLGIDPSNFVFEVVETEQVDDIEHLKKILMYYREQGFEYALDDVGEGFSTLEVLKQLSPTYMKLDMKFVKGVATNINKQAVAQKLLEAAIQVGSIPLAEGIEDREDFVWLKNKGFKLFQGYLFGKPVPLT